MTKTFDKKYKMVLTHKPYSQNLMLSSNYNGKKCITIFFLCVCVSVFAL